MNPSDSSCEIESDPDPTSGYHAMILEETNELFSSDWNQLKLSAPVVKTSISSMDVKVFKAAREGNIEALREQSNHLHQMLTPTKNTVLHVYIDYIAGVVGGAKSTTKSKELQKTTSAEVVREMLGMCQPLLLQPNQSGDTALHLAARHGRAEIVQVLIQAAKVRHGDLEEGISSGEACHQFLIRRTNKEKNTALHEAVRFNHFDVVKKLTEEDPGFLYPANDAGETPLYMAAERGHTKLVSKILDTCTSPSHQGPKGLTALHIAASYGDEEITKRLLTPKKTGSALAKATDEQGRTPLHMAAMEGEVSIVIQILECDRSTAYKGDKDKSTPVHYAAHKSYRCGDVLKQLYLYSPDSFELVDDKGRNALHIAIINNVYEVEEFVREDPWLSSVMLNGKDSDGNTPLHQMAISESYISLKFIGDSRVDKMTFNKENMNALDIYRQSTNIPWWINLSDILRQSRARWGRRLLSIRENSDGKEVVDVKKSDPESKFKELKESHLVVSALIATVTFAAGFTVPGGYVSEQGPNQGHAVLSRNAAFKAFVITNTLAMSLSSYAIMIHFCMLLRRKEITALSLAMGQYGVAISLTMYAMVAMVVAFVTGTYAVLGGPSSLGLAIAASVLGCLFFFGLGAVMLFGPLVSSSLQRQQDYLMQRNQDDLVISSLQRYQDYLFQRYQDYLSKQARSRLLKD